MARFCRTAPLARAGALALACSAVLLAACSSLGGSSGNMPPTVKVTNGALSDPQGLTLYVFDRDNVGAGVSVCNGPCAKNWPPLLAEPGTTPHGDFTIISREDGTRQWAYRGRPLYRFSKDANAGDRTGDNFNNVWHVATP